MDTLESSHFSAFNRAFIVGGGSPPPPDWLYKLYRIGDCIIAADRGALYLQKSGLHPDIMLGDFDSLPQNVLADMQKSCQQVLTFPCDKNYSDLELALRAAHRLGFYQAVIAAALGGRLDHCLFNVISLLQLADELGLDTVLVEPGCQVCQLQQKNRSWRGFQGWILSLIALDSKVEISVTGTKWPLEHSLLQRSSTRGLSNVITAEQAQLKCHKGRVIAVLSAPII
ncbi:MAG: thiamine diphosphokinase [Candidatus Bruticola sp.]